MQGALLSELPQNDNLQNTLIEKFWLNHPILHLAEWDDLKIKGEKTECIQYHVYSTKLDFTRQLNLFHSKNKL